MRTYVLHRHRNIRISESVSAEFPSDEEAIAAAKDCRLGEEIVGYDGKAKLLVRYDSTEPLLHDVAWSLFRVENKKAEPFKHDVLMDDVVTMDLLDLLGDLKGLDLDWPTDLRLIRSALRRAADLHARLQVLTGEGS